MGSDELQSYGPGLLIDEYDDIWSICPECGNEQPDMGVNVRCESCGFAPMPTDPDEASNG